MKKLLWMCVVMTIVGAASNPVGAAGLDDRLGDITVPKGFKIELYAHGDGLAAPRQMALGDKGTLFIGSRSSGKVFALQDTDGDHKADSTRVIFDTATYTKEKLMMPNGVAFRDGSLYVSAMSHVIRFDDIESKLDNPGDPVIVTDEFPGMRTHGWKYIAFGPDGKLYVPVGSPCDDCDNAEKGEIFATITRINADGTGREIIARGVRNSLGFDWHPETDELWFVEMGADDFGHDFPADELNRLTEAGQHFGFPFFHQGNIKHPVLGKDKNQDDYVAPALNLDPHASPLGMMFYRGKMFPKKYKNQILMAEHGSGGRPDKTGYRIALVTVEDSQVTGYDSFVEGFIDTKRDKAWGRPVDLLEMPDGSVLMTDDRTNAVYRISYE